MKKRQNPFRQLALSFSIACMFVLLSSIAFSQTVTPTGPDSITETPKGGLTSPTTGVTLQAKAGNVSALVISTMTATKSWQGYYGNITGTITLDDASNQTLYDWALPDPQGEIYASNHSSVTWSNVYCMNVSGLRNVTGANGAGGAQGIIYNTNGSQIELDFGINITDRDGLNETFNDTFTGSFRVGGTTIDVADGCSMTHPYTDNAYATGWEELLLTDNTSIIFTSIIRESANAYQAGAQAADFQMIVLEDGHPGSESTLTPYYFFVELT